MHSAPPLDVSMVARHLHCSSGMKAYRRVVVATDFSPGSSAAIGAIEALSGKDTLTVHLIHVLEPMGSLPSPVRLAHQRAVRTQARVELQRLVEALTKRLGDAVRVRTELTTGPAEIQICRLADRVRAHLIIVGSHGRSGFRRIALGSVAERVARFAKRPVLIVPLAHTHRRAG
jgi:nucleotide-binding universal stress UspA family protein